MLLGELPKGADAAPSPPAPRVSLRIDAPDLAGPWKMVVTNDGDVPLRFDADGRLLTFEIEAPPDEDSVEPYGKARTLKKKTPPSAICRLPTELRPAMVAEDRAVVVPPGARYEEVISPALYCFGETEAKALVPGARVTAKLGFPSPGTTSAKAAPRPPFIAEAATIGAPTTPVKELVSTPFTVTGAPPPATTSAASEPSAEDPNGPRLDFSATSRVDSVDEKAIALKLTVKNVGGRPVPLHVRRDNLVFDVDGPDGSAHCGYPSSRRAVPRDGIDSLAPGSTRSLDVWVGEMCPVNVFDRPGLYRIRAGLTFPASATSDAAGAWKRTIVTGEPILVRVRQGRLPFYTSPPQILGGMRSY
jgi:hypothetical protein